ncbi:MAG: ribonuclease J [Rhizobiales bacterium TMED94]|nr:MBL fold metallo-hydrolase [Rhodobiaceae bacterium]RPF88358.1 MAG: ribonuclease J [Rhizobiales bacterium TMED94]
MKNTYFLPLGGTGEIGMNLNLYGYGEGKEIDWFMVDCGVTFSQAGLPGIDLQMPDPTFIASQKEKLMGIILTHAHEDHIGAMPFIWPFFKCPIYTTEFTAALLMEKFDEYNIDYTNKIIIHNDGEIINIGNFQVKAIGLTHSIPEMNALLIKSPSANIFHTGDWKIDKDPIVGDGFNKEKLLDFENIEIDALVCDSTNAMTPGISGSELSVKNSLEEIIGKIEGRIFLSTFASNVARLCSVAEAAAKHDRHVVLSGRGMHRIVNAAKSVGLLRGLPDFVDEENAGYLPAEKTLILCTGSQGEYRAALSKIARDEHQHIVAEKGDTVIFSSKIIPGNEAGIMNLQNQFAKKDIKIITGKDEFVHVSGHPCQDELIEMYNLIQPKSIIPVHGEFRHLVANANLAKNNGIKNSLVIENGTVVKISNKDVSIHHQVESGRLYKDGKIIIYDYESPSNERSKISFTGLIVISIVLQNNKIKSKPKIKMIGLPEFDEEGIKLSDWVNQALDNVISSKNKSGNLESKIKNAVIRQIREVWGKKPKVEVIFH